MKLSSRVRNQFRAYGQRGGKARAARLTRSDRQAAARLAVLRRWIGCRFGDTSFTALGMPGGEIMDTGLEDLCAGRETPESLLICLAAPRLRREGVPLPRELFKDAEEGLYRLLERTSGDLAHARYRAYLRQATSFADACPAKRRRSSRA